MGEALAAQPGPVTHTVELAVREADLGPEGWRACAAGVPAPHLPPRVALWSSFASCSPRSFKMGVGVLVFNEGGLE